MGTPVFSQYILEKLILEGYNIVALVSQPDRPVGRKKIITPTPTKEIALKYNIPVYQPVRVREAECIEELRKYPADIMVVVGTSLAVYPAAMLVRYAKAGVPVFVVDPGTPDTSMIRNPLTHIKARAAEGMPELLKQLVEQYK